MRGRIVSLAVLGVLSVSAYLYREPLMRWFHLRTDAPGAPADPPPEGASERSLPEPARAALERAFAAADEARALLAADRLEGLPAQAAVLEAALRGAAHAVPGPAAAAILPGATAATRLGAARDLVAARAAFGDLSRALVAVAAYDPALRSGWRLFECPMATGYRKWLQRGEILENPYMGPAMLTCGGPTLWDEAPATVSHDGHGHAGSDVAFYTCSMHPSVQQAGAGQCPICGMDLTPVTWDEKEGGVVLVDSVRRQQIGVRTRPVDRGPMRLEIRAAGRVTWDERGLHDVTARLGGYVRDLHVNATGQLVKRGQRLFTLYSPELYAAQQDYLLALRERGGSADPARAARLVEAAETRLRLWEVDPAFIAELAGRGAPQEAVPFFAPASGYVLEKDVVAGGAVEPGQRLYRLAALSPVWVEADVYEGDLPHVRVGQAASVSLTHQPGVALTGRVAFVPPALDPDTRTARVRLELPNADGRLKPAMSASVELAVDLGERLRVPESAVLYTGPRRLVFVDHGEGRLRPQAVELGLRAGGWFEVLSGLSGGEQVVTSGNFLVAAESRIRSASAYWGEAPAESDHGGH